MPARRLRAGQGPSPEAIFAPLAHHATVGLAVSGGPDSLALMLLAAAHAGRHASPRFIVYSVDHGLRPEAADEVAFVLAEAARLGLSARGLRWAGRKPRTGVQEAARTARYRLMFDALRADGGSVLATAHHLEDQAETVLMRLAHGSGLAGLRAMLPLQPVEGGVIARPLLGVSRDALRAVVDGAGITPVADPSNDDPHYERVRWRQAMPALAALGLDARRLALFAARAGAASEAIDAAAREAGDRLVHPARDGALSIDRAGFALLPSAVGVELLSHALIRVGGAGKSRDRAPVEALHAALAASDPVPQRTLHGCLVAADARAIRIAAEPLTGARARARQGTKP